MKYSLDKIFEDREKLNVVDIGHHKADLIFINKKYIK